MSSSSDFTEGEGPTDAVQMSSPGEEEYLPTLMASPADGLQGGEVKWPERPTSATSQSLSGQCGVGSDGMMGLIRSHMTGILQPFAENVEELHKMVFSMTDSIRDLRTQTYGQDANISEQVSLLSVARTDLDRTMAQLSSMKSHLETTTREKAEETAELRATADNLKAITKQTLDKIDAVNVLLQHDIKGLQKGLERTGAEIAKLEKAENGMQTCIHTNKGGIEHVTGVLEALGQDHARMADMLKNNKLTFDDHVLKHEALQEDQKQHCIRFSAFEEEVFSVQSTTREQLCEIENKIVLSQMQMTQNREEASITHNALNARLDEHDERFHKTKESSTERFEGLDTRIDNQQTLVVHNGENSSKLVKLSDERRIADVKALRNEVEQTNVDASRHSRIISELSDIVYGRPPSSDGKNCVQSLLDEMKMTKRRAHRLEQMFGLEMLTEDTGDDAGLTLKNGILLTTAQMDDFKETFDKFDADGSGSISVLEISDVLKSLGHDVALDVVQVIVKDMTSDHSGEIAFDEFCSMMSKILGPDGKVDIDGYLKQMSEVAQREAKQNQMAELLPVLKQGVEEHSSIIRQEQSKLMSATQRVKTLEGEQATLAVEVEKLRKGLDSNNEYWKGLSAGLKETKRTVCIDGEGGMLPSARNLRNLPPLSPGHSKTMS